MKPTRLLSILALTFVLAEATPGGAQQYNFTTLAGPAGGPGLADGTGSAARFNYPFGVAVDSAGNVYVADTDNSTIRKITPGGVVSTLAGLAGSFGSDDGRGSAARFYIPSGVAVDSAGNVYVADSGNNTIRKITPDGMVSTLAGLAGNYGSADGTSSEARFAGPQGVAVDSDGNVYVTDGTTIRKITPSGVVSTLAGLAGSFGCVDGTGSAARFGGGGFVGRVPTGVAVDSAGNVYVADTGNSTIRKVTPSGVVSTLAGLAGNQGSTDETGSAARFDRPNGVAVDSAGNVYVADTGNAIRKITPGEVVSTLAGLAGYAIGVAVDSTGNLYVASAGVTIEKITPGGVVSTLAGLAESLPGSTDGTGSAARFKFPRGVAVDSAGNAYVGDIGNGTIRKITPGGVVSTLAGLAGNYGSADGTGSAARFSNPYSVAVDSAGNVYVADAPNDTIRKVTPGGGVSTLAGRSGSSGSADGAGSAARFWGPSGVAVDSGGNVYVADAGNSTIRKITPAGVVTTLAGLAGNRGSDDGTSSTARFNSPHSVAVDSAGNVYVADFFNYTIRKVTPVGVVTTLAGNASITNQVGSPAGGYVDGTGSAARFGEISGVAVDSAGNVYVADSSYSTIRKITPGGVVSTLAGLAGYSGNDDGTGSAARFNGPSGVAVDSAGNVYVTEIFNNTIRLGTAVLVTQPLVSANSLFRLADGPFQFEVTASTNQLVLIQAASVLPATNWNTIQTITLWNGRSTITDPGASDFPLRFYRAISPVP